MGHHFVPQRYLRNFEDQTRPEFIWMYDKLSGETRQVAIANVAQARSYYEADVEVELAERIEKPANPVIAKLVKGQQITAVERADLSLYIAVMLKRVPYRRTKGLEMVPSVVDKTFSEIRTALLLKKDNSEADQVLLEQRLRQVDELEQRYLREPPPEIVKQLRTPWPSQQIVDLIQRMTWRVLECSGPIFFLTSDNPAFYFGSFGLAHQEAELSFPLSTRRALHACWQGGTADLVFLNGSQRFVKEVNRREASTTSRFAFYHSDQAPWIHLLLKNQSPYLSRILW